jgi:hypothetical protein
MAQGGSSKSSSKLKLVQKAEDFFRELLVHSIQSQKVSLEPETEVYLVSLLSQFVTADYLYAVDQDGTRQDAPLVFRFKEALEAQALEEQRLLFRHLGDVSLYVAGFFPDSLNRKQVEVDYYIEMGGMAYKRVAAMVSDSAPKALFQELSEKFSQIVDVFGVVSDQTTQKTEVNLLRIYENYLRTNSERAKKMLEENGIIPVKTRFQIV